MLYLYLKRRVNKDLFFLFYTCQCKNSLYICAHILAEHAAEILIK